MPDIHAQRKDSVEHSEKAALDKSERTQKSDLPIIDLGLPASRTLRK